MPMIHNPYRHTHQLTVHGLSAASFEGDVQTVQALLDQCPEYRETPLIDHRVLAAHGGIASLFIKDERQRMNLGSFKALGAVYAMAAHAEERRGMDNFETALAGMTFICASAGNHGLSVAAGARLFGAAAVIVISETVPLSFEERLTQQGANVIRAGRDYDASMAVARETAEENGWFLLSDSSWQGYTAPAAEIMTGYLQLAAETVEQILMPPTHIFLQAGVGGMAAAAAHYFRQQWGDIPQILVIEPEEAACLMQSIQAGKPVSVTGGDSTMGRLDCKEPSHLALAMLATYADTFLTISDAEAQAAVDVLRANDLPTTPSGAAGVAALLTGCHQSLYDNDTRALVVLTETDSVS